MKEMMRQTMSQAMRQTMSQTMSQMTSYPLSRTQREIMEFELQYPGSSINNLSAYYELPQNIDESKLRLVLEAMLIQEQALRMQLYQQGDEIRQYEATFPLELKTETLAADEDLMSACEKQGHDPFKLWDSPLFRLTLLKTDTASFLLFTLHHVIADGWSMAQFAAHVQAGCERILSGELPDETMHVCTSFVEKEKHQLESGRFDADADYWKEQFADFTSRARVKPGEEPEDSEDGKRISHSFTSEELQALNSHCEKYRMSLAIPVLASIVLYLKKQNPSSSRIDIGQMILNRNGIKETQTIGNFAAEVLLCVPVSMQDTLQIVEQNVSRAALAAYHHSSFLHDDVLSFVQEQHPKTTFIRDVEFGYLPPIFPDGRRMNGAWVENCAPETAVEINLFQMLQKDELSLIMDYRTSVLTDDEAAQMLEMLRKNIYSVINHKDMKVDALLLSE